MLTEEVTRRRGEARFGALVRHASDVITVVDPDTTITYQSPSIERMLGYSADELHGSRFDRLVSEPDRSRLAHAVRAAAAGEDTQGIECSLVGADGEVRRFEILFTNLIDEDHVGGILLNARDVSERKAFEAELTHQAFHDTLTGLANRALFDDRVAPGDRAQPPRRDARSPCSSSTSTTSRRSTTRSATRPATRC